MLGPVSRALVTTAADPSIVPVWTPPTSSTERASTGRNMVAPWVHQYLLVANLYVVERLKIRPWHPSQEASQATGSDVDDT